MADEINKLEFIDEKAITAFKSGFNKELWERFKEGVGIIKDLDDSMTELKKISSETSLVYDRFQKQAGAAGLNVARSANDMVRASTAWKEMGYNLQEAIELANASSLYVNIGYDANMADTTKGLASIMKSFNFEAADSTDIVDRLSAVSSHCAVSAKDLGDILNRTSASMADTNTSFEKTLALGAALNEVIQNSAVAGTTLEVLSMRLRGAAADLEKAGESTDGMAASTAGLRKKILELTDVDGTGGFDIMFNDSTFKDVYVQLDGIAGKWKAMDDISRGGLLDLIAGDGHAQGVAALLNNWSEAEGILRTAMESAGFAEKENAVYLESVSGKLALLRAEYEELWQASIDDDTVKFFIDLATNAAKLATDLGGLVPVAGSLAAAFALIKNAGKQIRYRDVECALLIKAA